MANVTSDWDPLSEANLADPVAVQKNMRGKCPVAWTEQFGGAWAVFKHADIEQVAGDPETFSAAEVFVVPDMTGGVFPWLPVQSDPPQHADYRALVAPFFRGSRIAAFEPELVRIAHECIDSFIDDGHADVASQLNYRVSSSALAMLMGVPQEDGLRFKSWHEGMVSANASGDQEALGVTFMDLMGYVQAWMEKTKAEPGGDDLMSALMEADIDGRPLTNEEIFGTFILLIVGGFETTADVTSATLAHLAEDHELREQLRANPKLITKAVGEFARVFAPTQATARTATRDVEIGGRTICAGERVLQMWASGSRDEDVFPDPDKCDIDRPGKTQLTSFGSGNHRCLGEGLARIEIRAILSTWLERIDTFKVDGNPERGTWPTQGWHSMPMSFTARS